MRPCQHCGRPANFVQQNARKYKGTKKRRNTVSRDDHDLCQQRWRSLMEALRLQND